MKTKLTALLLVLFTCPLALAGDNHGHDHGKHEHDHHEAHSPKGPNGGQVIQSKAGFSVEVAVDKERKARIIFLDADNKATPLADQSVSGIAGERSAPVKLAFSKGTGADANALIADTALPAGAHVPLILMIKSAPDAKTVTERFELHLH